MKGESGIAKVGYGIQMKEVTYHELVATSPHAPHPRPVTSGWLERFCVLIALGMNLVSHFAYFVMQTLLKLVSDCSAVALNPSKKETASESPLKIALFSLAKMCSNHQICRQFVKSSELFPVIARLKHSP
ncbi:hypothetical protein Bca52824_080679 [Brassica carinata]|uniref:non-specific serine/threonine protein kinase n=1 Tax=Brassica carinata TaxID=52824 RepID=A0A8X7PGI1_BRACI|nr:hypothetical protein Bca52824_080679 [Brassica carinata]